MTPYYTEDRIAIYLGDCRELLPELLATMPRAGLALISDPPYGIGYRTSSSRSVLAAARDWPEVHGDDAPFDPSHLPLDAAAVVLWGANNYAHRLPPMPKWLAWYKRRPGVSNDSADFELAWSNLPGPARLFHHEWMGMLRDSEQGEAYHPTQKPVQLMSWVLAMVPEELLIVDPYMGAGSTLRAAKDLGRRAIGIEVDVSYCRTAVARLAQERLEL